MFPRQRWFLAAPLLLVSIGLPTLPAGENIVPIIKDGGKLFSTEGAEQGNKKVRAIYREYGKDVQVETIGSVPEDQQEELQKLGKSKFFSKWINQRARDLVLDGIYILICKNPAYLEVTVDEATSRKAFTQEDRKKLQEKMAGKLRQKENPRRFDEGLLEGLSFIDRTFQSNGVQKQERSSAEDGGAGGRHTSERPAPGHGGGGGMGSALMSWICLGLVALLVVWLVFGLIRAFTGAGRGGYGGPGYGGGGYGPGYGGGYGGGGGGFFSSLLGGMFGAAAGNWMYDSFFRGSHSGGSDWGNNPQAFSGGGGGTGDDTGTGVFGGNTGGADFGDDGGSGGGGFDGGGTDLGDSGGDAGGGGFDSGGADFGGGGDFGGGDFGGGGFDSGGTDF